MQLRRETSNAQIALGKSVDPPAENAPQRRLNNNGNINLATHHIACELWIDIDKSQSSPQCVYVARVSANVSPTTANRRNQQNTQGPTTNASTICQHTNMKMTSSTSTRATQPTTTRTQTASDTKLHVTQPHSIASRNALDTPMLLRGRNKNNNKITPIKCEMMCANQGETKSTRAYG